MILEYKKFFIIFIVLSLTIVNSLLYKLLPHPVIFLVLGLLPIGIYVILKWPFQFILGFVVFSFFRIHEAFPMLMPLKIPQLMALASIFAIGVKLVVTQDLKPYWSKELTWFSIFFVLITIGIAFAGNRSIAMNMWSGVYSKIFIMTLAVAWLTRDEKDFSAAIKAFIVAGFLIAFVALQNKAHGIGLVEGTRVTIGRSIGSVLGDPNDLALVLLFPAAFALSTLLECRSKRSLRLLALATFFMLLMAILATQSRGGLLGILSVVGIFVYKKIKSKVLVAMIGLIACLLLFAVAGISDRKSGGAAEDGIDESAMGRLYAWEAAYGMALDNPVLGVGLNNFYHNYFFYSNHWDGLNHAVHSTWFGVLAESGFLGLLIFILLVYATCKTAFDCWEMTNRLKLPVSVSVMARAVSAGMVGFIVSGTFLTQGFTWPLYIQLALVVATHRYIALFKLQNPLFHSANYYLLSHNSSWK